MNTSRWPTRAQAALARVRTSVVNGFGWRGPTGDGWPLGGWFAVIVLCWIFARLLSVYEPALLFVPGALAVAVAVPLLKRVGEGVGRSKLARVEPLVVAVTLIVVGWNVFDFVLAKRLPIDINDNQMYIGRAEILARGLAEGRLPRWSHLFQGGDPQLDLYPWFANLLVALLHRFVLADLPMAAAYTAVSLASWWLRGMAVYGLARKFSGPLIAAALTTGALLDIGEGIWDGTWHAGFFWGLIHSNIALSLCLIALSRQIACVRAPSTARIVSTALVVAAAVCAHPIAFVVQAAALGSLLITLLAARDLHRQTAWTVVATSLGVLLAALWLLPQTNALATYGFSFSAGGENYFKMGKGLLQGTTPGTSFGAFVGVALIAVAAALTRRKADSFFPAMATLALWSLALESVGIESQLLVRLPSLLGGQLSRLLVVASAFSIAPIAWLLASAFAHFRGPSSLRPLVVLGRAVVAAMLLLGPARSLGHALGESSKQLRAQFPAAADEPWRSEITTSAAQRAAYQWLKAARAADPSATPWRASMHFAFDHQYNSWISGVHTGVPVVQYVSNIVGMMLSNRPRELSMRGFHDWNVRYVVSEGPHTPLSHLPPRFAEGDVKIWEVPGYDDAFVVAPAGVMIRNLHLHGDVIRFDVAGAPPEGVDVKVRVAWYPRWRAYQGGRALAVNAVPPRPAALPKQDQIGLHVGNGPVELACNGPLPFSTLGRLLSLFAAILLATVAPAHRRDAIEVKLANTKAWLLVHGQRARAAAGLRPRATVVVIAGVLALVGVVGALSARRGFTMGPVSSASLRVWAKVGEGELRACTPAFWEGRYVCRRNIAIVEPGLGSKPVLSGDQSGEWNRLWPGTAVELRRPNTTVHLQIPRVALRERSLALEATVEGSLHVTIKVGNRTLLEKDWSGQVQERVALPSDLPRSGSVELHLHAQDRARIVFRGRMEETEAGR